MILYTLSLIYSSAKGSPYVATRNKAIQKMFDQIKFKKNSFFVELGSGDGRISRYVAKKYSLNALGVDVNALLIYWARTLTKVEKLAKKVQFVRKNIFNIDLSKADYLYIFLMPKLIEEMEPKLKKELKKEAVIISHGFPINGFKNKQIKKLEEIPFPTYYYKI